MLVTAPIGRYFLWFHLREVGFIFTLHLTDHLLRNVDGLWRDRERKNEFCTRIGSIAWDFGADTFGFVGNRMPWRVIIVCSGDRDASTDNGGECIDSANTAVKCGVDECLLSGIGEAQIATLQED